MKQRYGPFLRCAVWPALALMVAGIAATVLDGCAASSPPLPAESPDQRAIGPAHLSLIRLAQRQSAHPDPRVTEAPPPTGLELLERAGDEGEDATARRALPLPDLLRKFATPMDPPPAPAKPATPGEEMQALRLYASGREKLLRGDSRGGLTDLRGASDLDPTSGEVWLALGEAQGATGARAESLASIERAARLGAGGARPWEVLGRAALATGENDRAVALLSRAALASETQDADLALQSLIGIELGQALDALGYTRAAVESLSASLQLLDDVQGTQRYRTEIAAIARRRGDLWVRVGDLACREGDYAGAARAYATARELAAFGAGREGLLERLVFADIRTGNPGAAAEVVFESIVGREGWVSDPDLALCAYIRSFAGASAAASLDAAIEEYARTRDPVPSPALDSRLLLARTALLPSRKGMELLEARVKQSPSDDIAALAILEAAGRSSAADGAKAAVRLVRAAPLRTETFARALLTVGPLSGLLTAIDSVSDPAAGDLLAGRLLASVDRTDDALNRLDRAGAESRAGSMLRLGVELAVAEVAGADGRWARLDEALTALGRPWPEVDEGSLLWARAGALAAGQRFEGALDSLRTLADSPVQGGGASARMESLLAASELAGRLAMREDAERWSRAAADLDAYDERVYARLLGLYVTDGPLADQSKFADILRRLRQNCPDGPMLRALRAQDMLRRGAPEETVRQALSLARDNPTDTAALESLASASERWSTQKGAVGVPPEVESYLRARHERAPDDANAVIALARVLTAGGHADEAEVLLRAGMSQRDVSRSLEKLLRQSLGRADEANQMALSRLESPDGSLARARSITESIELAELLQHLERMPDAAAVLQQGIPESAMLTPSQSQVLLEITTRATTDGGNAPDPAGLALIEFAISHGVRLPREIQGRRLSLLVADPTTTPARLVAAAKRLETDYPDLGVVPYLFVLRNLALAESPDGSQAPASSGRTIAFVELAANTHPDADLFASWLRLIAESGSTADARRMIDSAVSASLEAEVIRKLESSGNQTTPPPPAPTGSAGAAELAQIAGDLASVLGRDEQAADLYRLSLTYDPTHAWAANNLGYHLAETARRPDGSIDRAALEEGERLLAVAAAALPDDGSVLDSLGWIRYRRGILRDQTDAEGKVTLEGAITLLKRAVSTSKGQDNETILDHLGDALWLAGEHDTAAGAWSLAEQAARQRLDRLRTAVVPRQALEQITSLLSSLSAKLAAVRAGMPPEVGWTTPGA